MTQFIKKRMKKNNAKIVRVNLEDVRIIRKKVLYKNLSEKFIIYPEDNYSETEHYGLIENSKVISVMTIIKKKMKSEIKSNLNFYQIRGMATLIDFQKKGFGSFFLKYILQQITNRKICDIIWCNSRKKIINFYLKNNFIPIGKIFNIQSIGPHQKLYYDLRNER